MATTLAGSTALVTGATSGIGREIALELAGLGAEVVVHGRSAERGAKTVSEIENAGGKARFVAADLGDADDVRRLAAEAGAVDILINNAGVYEFGATAETDDATFDKHVERQPARSLHPGSAVGAGDGHAWRWRGGQREHPGRFGARARSGNLRSHQGRSGTADPSMGRRIRRVRCAGECRRRRADGHAWRQRHRTGPSRRTRRNHRIGPDGRGS